jgi:hypothetical protein
LESKEKKSIPKEKGIVLKMLSEKIEATGEFRIPPDIPKLLKMGDTKRIFITLYSDGTINLERVPEELLEKVAEIIERVKVRPPELPSPLIREKKLRKPKVPVKEIPKDWIPLTKTYLLTPEGEIRRPSGHLNMRKEKVIKIAKVLKSSTKREEAISRLADELKLTKSVIEVAYPLITKALPHLEKLMPEKLKVTEETKPAVKIEPPKELLEVLRKKEEEKISSTTRRVEG